ncbi:COQ9 family protein [Oceanomicrobium pacificus]|uniref:COQ9 family protein n=1 Tax=Oceanomicrobium pacificus TaxID=2692916 RepID=A0A6B0U0P9_9RHOB|nr:COQ9 family protein [Oceanomicrobium pacificus]MXU66813.1 COQ9 family protein [Oceanomicrobium pacificus]
MTDTPQTPENKGPAGDAPGADIRDRILDAALVHVAFDGWSADAIAAAASDAGVEPAAARAAFPRGGVDLARAFHLRGDAQLRADLEATDLGTMRFRDRVAYGVRHRLELIEGDKEIVRRAAALFALPQNAADGTALVWNTADVIWSALGDTSQDVNWYTKRATLSGVYSATLLYWLGDDSDGHARSWAFLDRRIENVMQFEKFKAKLRENPIARRFEKSPFNPLELIRAPRQSAAQNLPGSPRR